MKWHTRGRFPDVGISVGHELKSGTLPLIPYLWKWKEIESSNLWILNGLRLKNHTSCSQQQSLLPSSAAIMSGSEIVILLIGPTGSGKTSFIRHATGLNVDSSSTTSCSVYRPTTPIGPQNFLIIDTPGLDDLAAENLGVLKEIAQTLSKLAPRTVGGAIFFHRILDGRFSGSARSHLDIFKQICGTDFGDQAVFVTTMWNLTDPKQVEKYNTIHEELKKSYFFLSPNSKPVFKFGNDAAKAKEVLKHFINPKLKRDKTLLLDREVKRFGASLSGVRKTSAGKEIMKSANRKACVIL
ncbi:P-loop containing nucleoside triphosphate hydrolase protein [Cercophora newfieldiana]|uniref:P-loop containing nucleoside triphosphate hydrolase protein n=1 Tax=Cercophora newfieldiana TaxID=92897 RepID=A0AA40CS08_9PEZI|nr:P-loop containing nucleoside triphosphate hydrolase protein [Cercophora newfieldiana]